MSIHNEIKNKMSQMSDEDIKKAWSQLRSGDAKKPESMKLFDFSVGVKIANQMSQDDYIQYVRSGDVPVLKLSSKEMELLSGGAAAKAASAASKSTTIVIACAIAI